MSTVNSKMVVYIYINVYLVDADLIAVLGWLNTVGHIWVRGFVHADEHSAPLYRKI